MPQITNFYLINWIFAAETIQGRKLHIWGNTVLKEKYYIFGIGKHNARLTKIELKKSLILHFLQTRPPSFNLFSKYNIFWGFCWFSSKRCFFLKNKRNSITELNTSAMQSGIALCSSKELAKVIWNILIWFLSWFVHCSLGPKMFGVVDFWLEIRVIIKISTQPCYPRTFDQFSLGWSKKKNSKWPEKTTT